jgi:hypothetical protein
VPVHLLATGCVLIQDLPDVAHRRTTAEASSDMLCG